MIYFTSDSHFWHRNITKLQKDTRAGFETIEGLNEAMIEKWNDTVAEGDTVWHLGDLSFGSHDKSEAVFKRLNGSINLVRGNHDYWVGKKDLHKYFQSINDYKELKWEGMRFVLFHFPIYEWNFMHHGAFHLYGHMHGAYQNRGKSMDVGVDTRDDLGLYSIYEVVDKLSGKEQIERTR